MLLKRQFKKHTSLDHANSKRKLTDDVPDGDPVLGRVPAARRRRQLLPTPVTVPWRIAHAAPVSISRRSSIPHPLLARIDKAIRRRIPGVPASADTSLSDPRIRIPAPIARPIPLTRTSDPLVIRIRLPLISLIAWISMRGLFVTFAAVVAPMIPRTSVVSMLLLLSIGRRSIMSIRGWLLRVNVGDRVLSLELFAEQTAGAGDGPGVFRLAPRRLRRLLLAHVLLLGALAAVWLLLLLLGDLWFFLGTALGFGGGCRRCGRHIQLHRFGHAAVIPLTGFRQNLMFLFA